MNENDQVESEQPRRGPVSHGIDAINKGRRAYKLLRMARAAGTAAKATEAVAATAPVSVPVIIGIIIVIVLFVFFTVYSQGPTEGEAASLPGGGTPTLDPVGGGGSGSLKCNAGTNLCSPENLSSFGSNANTASIICNAESGGQSNVINKDCLKGISVDYSVGLFQFNMMAQCAKAFSCLDTTAKDGPSCAGGTYCTIGNPAMLDNCVATFLNVKYNMDAAVKLSNTGTDWSHWGAAGACGIL